MSINLKQTLILLSMLCKIDIKVNRQIYKFNKDFKNNKYLCGESTITDGAFKWTFFGVTSVVNL